MTDESRVIAKLEGRVGLQEKLKRAARLGQETAQALVQLVLSVAILLNTQQAAPRPHEF